MLEVLPQVENQVKLIQNAKLDARIDSEKCRVVMSKAPPSVYQQAARTKGFRVGTRCRGKRSEIFASGVPGLRPGLANFRCKVEALMNRTPEKTRTLVTAATA